jgi:RHS repeat-associated protein
VEYTYGIERISQKRIIPNSSFLIHHYISDGQGSIRQLTAVAGDVTDTYDYFAFGEILNKTGTTENEFQYVGEQVDVNSGFYYNRARWMNPNNGRFVSVDPFVGDKLSPISLHRYLYGNSSPISYSDPSGRNSIVLVSMAIAVKNILGSNIRSIFWGNNGGPGNAREGFDELWNAYPQAPLSSSGVYSLIGGRVLYNHTSMPDRFSNSCALRMSRAMNYGGHEISFEYGKTGSGDDNKWYYYKVKDLLPIVESKFGSPDETNVKWSDVRMKRGIILFEDCGNTTEDGRFQSWSDATGHIDLWNKVRCGSTCYWNNCNNVSFWSFK